MQFFGTIQRKRQVHLLHLAQRRQIGDKQDAATDFLQCLLTKRAAHGRQVEPRRARRQQGARSDFAHAAGCALDQYHRSLGRGLFEAAAEFLDERQAGEGFQRQRRALRRCVVLERLLHGGQQLLQADRLFQEIEGAETRRLDGRVDGAVTGHHDHRHVQVTAGMPFLEQRNTVGVRHPDVEQDQVRAQLLTYAAGGAGVLGEADIVALVDEDFGKQFADADFVINDQNDCHAWPPCPEPAAGGYRSAPRHPVHC